MIGESHLVDPSFRILQKTGEDFRRIGRPERGNSLPAHGNAVGKSSPKRIR
jgi:hypothetical protein